MKVLIGTKNPGKIEGARKAFEHFFDDVQIEGIPVSSEVGGQPVNVETYEGAKNRVANLIAYAKENGLEADYYIAIESGLVEVFGNWQIMNVAVIADKSGYQSMSTSSSFPVPKKYIEEIKKNELSSVMDRLFHKADMRSGKGGISGLTRDAITRIDLTEQAFVMALTSFINDFWNDKN